MGSVSEILRNARNRDRRFKKARSAVAALSFDEKGCFVAELLRDLQAGPPKPTRARGRRRPVKPGTDETKTVKAYVTAALSAHAPLNASGIHAVIERTNPGVVDKGTLTAAVSRMFAAGLIVKAGTVGRGASFALPNGGAR